MATRLTIHFADNRNGCGKAQLAAHAGLFYTGAVDEPRARQIELLEQDAEMLAVYQLDLLAQLERQLRAVHLTMRHIEKLRSVKNRVGPELSNGRRESELTQLDVEVGALDAELAIQHGCCIDMHDTIAKMQARVTDLRQRTSVSNTAPDSSGAES
jgi:hypothetical protein